MLTFWTLNKSVLRLRTQITHNLLQKITSERVGAIPQFARKIQKGGGIPQFSQQ